MGKHYRKSKPDKAFRLNELCKKQRDNERRPKRHKRWRPSPGDTERTDPERFSRMRIAYLKAHPACERCGYTGKLTIHHKAGNLGENFYRHFMATCRPCHDWIHEPRNKRASYELGYLIHT